MSSTIDFQRFTLRQLENAAANARADYQADILRRAERLRVIARDLLSDGEPDAAWALVQRAEVFESVVDQRRRDAALEIQTPREGVDKP